jgi:hypothetical protein
MFCASLLAENGCRAFEGVDSVWGVSVVASGTDAVFFFPSFCRTTGPLASELFVPGSDTKDMIHDMLKILVVGAGGLGCELRECF